MRLLVASLCLVLLPTLAHAHAIGLDCTLRGANVDVEVYYDDDSPAQKASVQVINVKEEIIVNGLTDDKGKWSFPTPAPGKYEVRVDGGAGHRAKRTLVVPGTKVAEPAPGTEVSISDGGNRAEFTSIPWLKIAIGLFVIGGCAGVCVLGTLLRKA